MFLQRTSLQKPEDELLTSFRQQFPEVVAATSSDSAAPPVSTVTAGHANVAVTSQERLALGIGLGTPLSMPTTEGALHSGIATVDLSAFHQGYNPHHFYNFNPFIQPPLPQPSVHQDTGHETMDPDGSPMDSNPANERIGSINNTFREQPQMTSIQARQIGSQIAVVLPTSAENFRFHATLNAPTAMIKHSDEIPVTYLNKGQAYSISIVDTTPTLLIIPGTRFRTSVRISFEDEQQQQKPGVYWSLWKEGRGTKEAHQRGGKLQAVEYVEADQPAEGDKRTRIELETASFDAFSVIWTPVNRAVECNIAVRFNFLSTDFSHSKGVKGTPVRLCAKTSRLASGAAPSPPDETAEICYCKVKLFRDHGAQRKLSNDAAYVKKTINELKQQITQAESELKDFGERKKAGGSQMKGQDSQRVGKVQKHKCTWSMPSASSAGGGGRLPLKDLQFRLQTLQDMFTSTRPVSVLYLRGEGLDDPDFHPVSLPGESLGFTKVESRDNAAWRREQGSAAGSSHTSPSPHTPSLHSQVSSGVSNSKWQGFQQGRTGDPASSQQGSDQPTKASKTNDADNLTGGRPAKPVACFYIARKNPLNQSSHETHHAIYLMHRTLRDFVDRIATKWSLDSSKIVRTVHSLQSGLEVQMDDDVIRELAEEQDMILEVAEISKTSQHKQEWEMAVDAPGESEAVSPLRTQMGYELRLT